MTSRYSSVAHDSSEYSSSLHERLSMRLSPDKKRYTLSDILRWLVKTVPPRASEKFMDTLSGSPKFVAPTGARPRRTMLVPWAIRAHICDRPRSWFGQRSAVFLSRTARFNVWSEQTLKSYPCHCTEVNYSVNLLHQLYDWRRVLHILKFMGKHTHHHHFYRKNSKTCILAKFTVTRTSSPPNYNPTLSVNVRPVYLSRTAGTR